MNKQDFNIWEGSKVPVPLDPAGETQVIKKSPIDINFRRVLSVWPWMIAGVLAGALIGMFYLRYVAVIYSVSTSVIIEEDEDVNMGRNNRLSASQRDPLNNKIAFFRSPALASRLVDTLGLRYTTVAQGRIKDKDFYGNLKWRILNDSIGDRTLSFTINALDKGFLFESDKIKGQGNWGVPFNLNGSIIIIEKTNPNVSVSEETPIDCYSSTRLAAAFNLSSKIQVNADPSSNILNINYSDISSNRAIDVLHTLVDLYNQTLEQEKSRSFSQAISFIDNRLMPLGEELDSIQTALARYKSARRFIGNSTNGPLYQSKVQQSEDQLKNINSLKNLITEVERFITDPNIPEASMVLMGISDGVLQGSMRAFQEARRERDRLALIQTPNNPTFILAEKNLTEQRKNLDIQLANFKNQLAMTEGNYQSNLKEADALLRATPMEEKELLDKQRMMSIKENLFLSLLQRKEEASISRASVTVNTTVLYPPAVVNAVQSPSPTNVLSLAILAGLFLPLLVAISKELLNKSIISKKQLQGMTPVPVIAEVEQTEIDPSSPFVIDKNKRSVFGEQVRTLRTNLNFYPALNKPVAYLMITSSVSGEGKTFLSLNLAKGYSLQGKKVALLEFDLRRPKISGQFKIPSDHPGLSSYLAGKCKIKDMIKSCADDTAETLDLFISGPVPPNPQELMSVDAMQELKKYLDEHYDIVIIDTSPFGLVADAQILGKWADVTLVVTRHGQTNFEQVYEIGDWYAKSMLPNISIILNGVKSTGYFGNKYGYYSYRKKYGYGYYTYGGKPQTKNS